MLDDQCTTLFSFECPEFLRSLHNSASVQNQIHKSSQCDDRQKVHREVQQFGKGYSYNFGSGIVHNQGFDTPGMIEKRKVKYIFRNNI